VQAVVGKYCGEILQMPPMYSAIKINGKKLYEIARAGGTAELEPRKVVIRSIGLRNFDGRKALIDVVCSKGTYIRSLCKDIGEELGCGAHMSFLVRTAVGDFTIEDALPINELAGMAVKGDVPFMPLEIVLNDFTEVRLNIADEGKFLNGIAISRDDLASFIPGTTHPDLAVVRGTSGGGQIMAIGEFIGSDGKDRIKIKAGKLLMG
jgi:tRNA pseudouridine55 synthase